MYDAYSRVLRQEYLEEFWQNAANRCQKARGDVFYVARVCQGKRAAKPVYRHRRFQTMPLYIPF